MIMQPENVYQVATYESIVELHQDGGIAIHPPRKIHHILRQLAGYSVRVELSVIAEPNDHNISIVRMAAATMKLEDRWKDNR